MMTFCVENDGPKVEINASAEGNCATLAFSACWRGDRGSLLCDRGLFVNDEDGANPETWETVDPPVLDAPSCHSFDLAVLMPRRCLEPNGVSLSFGDRFNVLIRLQSLENTSSMLSRTLLSMAATSHSARDSCVMEPLFSLFPVKRRCACDPTDMPSRSPPVGDGEFSRRNWLTDDRNASARCESFSMFLPLSYHPGENTSCALSSIISTAATMGSMSLWCRRHHMAALGGLTRSGATRCTKRRRYRAVPQ
mmetsp:Transcript_7067/g.12529  ORF Transcript_7067/g.12529 Transcript_7067/m.12529 type:complete len:251 (-) Transcript_7067:342-1094(-)